VKAPDFVSLLMIYDKASYPYTIESLGDVTVQMINIDSIYSLMKKNGAFASGMLKHQCNNYRLFLYRQSTIYIKNLWGRTANFILWLSEGNKSFTLPVSRIDMAGYMDVAPENVSNVLNKMKRDGIIELKGKEINILNRKKMISIAQKG
jgi:CRP/FNR family transcriptional regulator